MQSYQRCHWRVFTAPVRITVPGNAMKASMSELRMQLTLGLVTSSQRGRATSLAFNLGFGIRNSSCSSNCGGGHSVKHETPDKSRSDRVYHCGKEPEPGLSEWLDQKEAKASVDAPGVVSLMATRTQKSWIRSAGGRVEGPLHTGQRGHKA